MVSGRRTLSQAVSAEILERIRSGLYRPGEKLATEREIMAEFDVGRNVAREAIQALVALGLVDVRPGRGSVVLGTTATQAVDTTALSALLYDHSVDDLNEFRRVIEVEIATRAAKHATDSDLAVMRRQLDQFRSRFEAGLSVVEPELGFHDAIAHASQNAVYYQVLELLRDRLANARSLVEHLEWVNQRAMDDHEAIFAAIEAHDSDAARRAMAKHMELAAEAIAEARRLRDERPE